MSENRVIAKDNKLPWSVPEDLNYFLSTTRGHPLIMGRKTFQSMGSFQPSQPIFVFTRTGLDFPKGVQVVSDRDTCLRLCRDAFADEEVFVTGGGDIYRLFIDMIDRLYLTTIYKHIEGNITFPEVDMLQWTLVSQRYSSQQEPEALSYVFRVYNRACVTTSSGSEKTATRQS